MADFSQFGNPSKEWQEHLAKYGPPPELPTSKLPAVAMQKSVNAGREEVSGKQMKTEGLSSRVDIQTFLIHARDNFLIPTRVYSPKNNTGSSTNLSSLPIYVFYHGGGFIFGTLDSEDAACSRIVAATKIIVVSIDYRHTPKHPFPAAHNDALDAFDWIVENAEAFGGDVGNVIVGGVSAGANLAVNVALNARLAHKYENGEGATIKGLILDRPWLVINEDKIPYNEFASKEKSSRVQCSEAPVVPSKVLEFFIDRMGDGVQENGEVDPDVGLIRGKKLRRLPSTTIIVAGSDPLRDEGLLFAQNLHRNGVPVNVHVFPGLPHEFRRFNDLPSSHRLDDLVVESIKWSLKNPKASLSSGLSLKVE